jgi:hypothetical protein
LPKELTSICHPEQSNTQSQRQQGKIPHFWRKNEENAKITFFPQKSLFL